MKAIGHYCVELKDTASKIHSIQVDNSEDFMHRLTRESSSRTMIHHRVTELVGEYSGEELVKGLTDLIMREVR